MWVQQDIPTLNTPTLIRPLVVTTPWDMRHYAKTQYYWLFMRLFGQKAHLVFLLTQLVRNSITVSKRLLQIIPIRLYLCLTKFLSIQIELCMVFQWCFANISSVEQYGNFNRCISNPIAQTTSKSGFSMSHLMKTKQICHQTHVN